MGDVVKLKTIKLANPTVGRSPASTNPTIIAIEKDYKNFRRRLKVAKQSGSSIDLDELRWLRRTVRKLIPVAANVFATYKNDRAAVALNVLINQQRELLTDIRALDAGPRQLEHIMQRIITPLLQALMQQYLSEITELKKQLRKLDKAKRRILMRQIDDNLRSHGQIFNTLQEGMRDRLTEYLVGKNNK